jgi:predicted transcriptional regulator
MTVREIIATRKKLGLTQKQMARLLSKHQTFVCKLEKGKRILHPETVIRVKKAFARHRKEKRRVR